VAKTWVQAPQGGVQGPGHQLGAGSAACEPLQHSFEWWWALQHRSWKQPPLLHLHFSLVQPLATLLTCLGRPWCPIPWKNVC